MFKMSLKKICFLFVLVLVVAPLLVACGGESATATRPSNTAVAATTAPAVTTALATTAPAVTTAAATTVAPTKALTTAAATTVAPTKALTTAAATKAASTATNTVTGLGITLSFPATWNTNVQDKDGEGVLSGTNPDGSYITIYRFTKGEAVQGDLMTRANNLLDNLKTSFSDLTVVEQPNQISSDTVRLGIEYTSKDTGKVTREVVLVIDDASLKATYLVEAGVEKAKFTEATKNDLVAILNTLKTNPAAVTATTAPAVTTGKETVVKGLGINLTFPTEWQTQVNEKAGEGSILSYNPQGSYINIFRFTSGDLVQGNLTDRTTAVADYLKKLFPDMKIIEQPNLVSPNASRFSAQYTDPDKKNTNVEVVIVLDDEDLKATFVVEAGSDKTKFDGQKDVLINIVNTLKTN